MTREDAVQLLKEIIAEERRKGCPMATESLVDPALRRWGSYERRFKGHKDKSLTHRAHDLEKGLLEWYEYNFGFGYDPGCISHLALSFAEVLFRDATGGLTTNGLHSAT